MISNIILEEEHQSKEKEFCVGGGVELVCMCECVEGISLFRALRPIKRGF